MSGAGSVRLDFWQVDTDVDIEVLFDALIAPTSLPRLQDDLDEVQYGDLVYLLPASALFRELVAALEVRDDDLRLQLHQAMSDAGTRADLLGAEDLWFLLPDIERVLLAPLAEDDATRARARLQSLLRGLRYDG